MGLKQWAKENSKFLKLEDGESVDLKYMGYVMSLNKDGDEIPAFKFQTKEGKIKILQSRSGNLCAKFDETEGEFKKGDTVTLTRKGLGQQTTYDVVPVVI